MTPPRRPRSTTLPQDDRPVLRVRDPGELVAAVPAMLGFHPRESLVLMATGGRSGRRLGLTLRVDLPPPEHPAYPEHVELVAASAVRGLLLDDPAGAVAVVVAAPGAELRADPGADPRELPHPGVAGLVALALEEQGVQVHTLLWAEGTTAGARWACYDPCGCSGFVPDPAATAFVAAAVAEGRVVHDDRAALEALVAPGDADRLRRREELLIEATDAALRGPVGDPGGGGAGLDAYPAAGRAGVDPAAGRAVVDPAAGRAVVDTAITDAAAGRLVLSDARVVALAGALGIPEVRDAALQWCTGPRASAAEQLWAALARETPDPEAAEPAALLAVSALLRGDGALANIALDRAERAWPGHRLSGLLRSATEAGLRPSQVRGWLRECRSPAPGPRGRAAARRPRPRPSSRRRTRRSG